MPSSLTRVISRALGSSPHLPVSVYGTGTSNLTRGFSRQSELSRFATCLRSPSLLMVYALRICLQHPLVAWTCSTNGTLGISSCVTPLLITICGGIGISTNYPSLTPFGLSLGPDLPWADEPSPGNLRFSAGRILTFLFAYSYQHSLL